MPPLEPHAIAVLALTVFAFAMFSPSVCPFTVGPEPSMRSPSCASSARNPPA